MPHKVSACRNRMWDHTV